MAKLVVRALRCVEETNEYGNDDVYMVVFRGSLGLPPDVKVVGGKDSPWAGMHTGKLVTKDVVLDDSYSPEHAYVVILVEQDSSKDISTDGAWGKVAEFWANNWIEATGNAAREFLAMHAMILGGGLKGGLTGDEFLGVKSIPQIYKNGGTGILFKFEADGGIYRARVVRR